MHHFRKENRVQQSSGEDGQALCMLLLSGEGKSRTFQAVEETELYSLCPQH